MNQNCDWTLPNQGSHRTMFISTNRVSVAFATLLAAGFAACGGGRGRIAKGGRSRVDLHRAGRAGQVRGPAGRGGESEAGDRGGARRIAGPARCELGRSQDRRARGHAFRAGDVGPDGCCRCPQRHHSRILAPEVRLAAVERRREKFEGLLEGLRRAMAHDPRSTPRRPHDRAALPGRRARPGGPREDGWPSRISRSAPATASRS